MVEGETSRFWMLQMLACHGQDGAPKGMLVFDIEFITINTSFDPEAGATRTPDPWPTTSTSGSPIAD
jgi:hypothetical protein